jgi:hypothetical protein
MALSDYLSSEEWDACYYASFFACQADNFGDSMHQTIEKLLASGYKFQGLDENGHKHHQVSGTNNPQKLMKAWFGEDNGVVLSEVIANGRNFLKQHCSSLVVETDAQFEEAIAALREHEKAG